jgi:hypothetical protein
MPRDNEGARDKSANAPANPPATDQAPAAQSRGRAASMPATDDAPLDPELAAFRRRLDQQLSAQRGRAKDLAIPVKPGRMTAALARAMEHARIPNVLLELPPWLTIAPVAACLVVAGIVWWVHRDATVPMAELVPVQQMHEELSALQKERDKVEQLSQELAMVWRELTAQTAALGDKAAQDRELDDLRQMLHQSEELAATHERLLGDERRRGDRLEDQLKERSRELEQEIAVLRKALRQADERSASQERALTQERDRNRALAQQVATHREAAAAAVADKTAHEQKIAALLQALKQAQEPPAATPVQSSGKAVLLAGPPAAAVKAATAVASDDTDLPRLMVRARALLMQGDVGPARILLERAAQSGNAVALFALAETFDPKILSAWGAQVALADVARARELYGRALAEGVVEAKERLAAMR